ncbi:hypothetical protein [Marinifilum caeruleilacunae]|uniref:DUF2946 domain-containing protein n=1 Tax=Marinifilum caeruleilacunae TaxID=2499076 RepID=A0ABX1X1E6_9BACT|nr:hypothetical protein [Marinifilum caeruleilacunae]NOU61951.1 hypothetical protein [Marinifilum caeruleilacunae]
MFGLKKHIAILLFGIFFFPLAYQPWHVIVHHSQDSQCHHACCHSKGAKKTCDFGHWLASKVEKQESCPVCEYHFPINIIPELNLFKPKNPNLDRNLFELETSIALQQIDSRKSPRAPPLSIKS